MVWYSLFNALGNHKLLGKKDLQKLINDMYQKSDKFLPKEIDYVFQLIDKDNSGFIDIDELKEKLDIQSAEVILYKANKQYLDKISQDLKTNKLNFRQSLLTIAGSK